MHCVTLEQYLTQYGRLLAQQAQDSLQPLHVPGRDRAEVPELLREPFDAQAHVIAAGVKALNVDKALWMVAEMGTGKTLMGQATVHAHARGRPYRAIVMCPGHLTRKWKRELEETIPFVRVKILESWRDVVALDRRAKPEGAEWYVIGRDTAKLSCGWEPRWYERAVCRTSRKWKDGLGQVHKHGPVAWTDGLKRCPACFSALLNEDDAPLTTAALHRKPLRCRASRYRVENGEKIPLGVCGEFLWQKVRKPDRWSPATYIHRKLKGFFTYAVFDEIHEEKGEDTAQAVAMGEIASAVRKCVCLTGTLIGGYAKDLRTLLWRLMPWTLADDRLDWKQAQAFSERYGRIQRRVTEKHGKCESNSQSRGSRRETTAVKPGIMPTLFAKLIGNCVFLGLGEVAENLPELEEDVLPVVMDDEQATEYERLETTLSDAIKDMVRKGDKRLLGPMLQTLLGWVDYPYDWQTVGYHDRDRETGARDFVPVVTPASLDREVIRPKEEKLLEVIGREQQQGRQVWVFVQYTDTHDVLERLRELVERHGYSVEVLRASVEPKKREQWIETYAVGTDVILSHPQLVETGVDLFDKGGAHNFATLIFYETGYRLTTMRQASRRSWRIGQRELCRVVYLYYQGTMQDKAMAHMGKKLVAALALEGTFSEEGLAALVGTDDTESAEMQLARSLDGQLDDEGAMRSWQKVAVRASPKVVTAADEQAALLAFAQGAEALRQGELFPGLGALDDNPFRLLAQAQEKALAS